MIGGLKGVVVSKNPPQVSIDVNGVEYEVDVPMSTFCALPAAGEQVSLRTHLAIREDGHFLFGFLTEMERKAFRMLMKVSGIGAKSALSVLSGLSVAELFSAIAHEDVSRLVKVPGIGKKTAERLVLELKDVVAKFSTPTGEPVLQTKGGVIDDVSAALVALGYSVKEADAAAKAVTPDMDVSAGIRVALKSLQK